MKKLILLYLTLLSCYNSYAQKFSGLLFVDLDKSYRTYSSVNQSTLDNVIYFYNSKKTIGFKLDSNTAFIDSTSTKFENKYNKIIADYTDDSYSKLIFSDENFTSFVIQEYDLKNNKISSNEIYFDIFSRKFLQVFYLDSTLYILSFSTANRSLYITTYKDGKTEEKNILFAGNDLKFIDKFNNYCFDKVNLEFQLKFINSKTKYINSNTKHLAKCYLQNAHFYATIDDINSTEILNIDLNTKKVEFKSLKNELATSSIATNSILVENQLYHAALVKEDFQLTVYDLNGNLLKKYKLSEIQNPYFFNEIPIGTLNVSDKKTFLKKNDKNSFSLVGFKNYENVLLLIGSETNASLPKESPYRQSNYAQIGGMTGGLVGSLIGAIIDYNSSLNSNSLQDFLFKGYSFNQIQLNSSNEIVNSPKNQFSIIKLKNEIINSDKNMLPLLFNLNEDFFFGYYEKKEKKYFIKKFYN